MSKAPIGKKRAPATRSTSPRPAPKDSPARKGGHASAARTAAAAAKRRRSRMLTAGGATAAVVLLIIVLVVVKLAGGGSSSTKSAVPSTPTPPSVLTALSGIPPTQLAQRLTAVGGSLQAPSTINDAALTSAGKPEVLYIGAGYCPYCAAERWPLVTALLHFGTFTGLSDSASSPIDINPNTPTLSFHGATYTSQYLTFIGIEETTNQPRGGSYVPLDVPTAAEQAVEAKYGRGIPFIDFGGKFMLNSAQYDGRILAGMTPEQVATQAADPSTQVGTAIEASAGSLTATLCHLTGGQPASVCGAFPGA